MQDKKFYDTSTLLAHASLVLICYKLNHLIRCGIYERNRVRLAAASQMNLGASHQQTLNLFQIYYTRLQTNLFFENDVYTIC
jgi:hypothetical protein